MATCFSSILEIQTRKQQNIKTSCYAPGTSYVFPHLILEIILRGRPPFTDEATEALKELTCPRSSARRASRKTRTQYT